MFRALNSGLAWATRQVAKADVDPERKLALMEKLRARANAATRSRQRIRTARDLQTWAELWVDRAYLGAERRRQCPPAPSPLRTSHARQAPGLRPRTGNGPDG